MIIDTLKLLQYKFFGPNKGPKVALGGSGIYYMSMLQDRAVNATSNIVLFSSVNPGNEAENVSWGVIKQGQYIGVIVGCTDTPGTFYLCVKNESGTFFFEPQYLHKSALDGQGVLNASELDAKEKQYQESPLFKIPNIVWAAIGLAGLYFLSKIFKK